MMIGKVIERDKNKPSSIANLNFYVMADKKEEKLEVAGTINIDGDITTATDEMLWLAAQNKRCKDPYMHCLLTWREGEHPTEFHVSNKANSDILSTDGRSMGDRSFASPFYLPCFEIELE